MDHLHIPESCKVNVREIPYLGVAPKYDGLGFDGFPERNGRDANQLVSSQSVLEWRAEWIESFIQEWLWFGLLDEFGKACGIVIEFDDFIVDSPSGSGKIITTASIYETYARRLAIRKLDVEALKIGLDMGDLVRLPFDSTEVATPLIIDFWSEKMGHGLPSIEDRKKREQMAIERLSLPYGSETIEHDSNGAWVPIHALRQRSLACQALLANLMKQYQQPDSALTERRLKLAESISRTQGILKEIMDQFKPVVRLDIVLSIDSLCHTLANIVLTLLWERILLKSPNFSFQFEEIMVSRNWCPARITAIANPDNTPLGYITSLLPSYDDRMHRECRPRKCLKMPPSRESMFGIHRDHCDRNCAPITVPQDRLIQMWKEGAIPGIRLYNDSIDENGVDIVDCSNIPFVAISHVWAHGLGNPNKNELPSCQFQFLCDSSRALDEANNALWIDTLSVPVDEDGKRIAISKLRKVYSDASKVLVIDKHLMQVGDDQTEQMLQLLGSEWQRRLWTLQEGRLARELFIKFKNGCVPVSELTELKPLSEFSASNANAFDFFLMLKEDMRTHFAHSEDPQPRFTELVEDLAPRSVTNREDEPICLATLLGLSLEEYDPYPTMVDIYRSFTHLPQDLIFLKQPRLDVPGLTWAPSTFLETEYVSFVRGNNQSDSGQLTEEGLHITKDCLVFDEEFDFRRIGITQEEVYLVTTPHGQTFAVEAPDLYFPEGGRRSIQRSRMIKNPALIWEKPYSLFARVGYLGCTSKAVLVSRELDREGVSFCKFEMMLEGWNVRDEHQIFHDKMIRQSGGIVGRVSAGAVEGKSFCIG